MSPTARAFDVATFMLDTLIPAVLESEWVDGAGLIRSACVPFGAMYGQHTDEPAELYPEWRTICTDPLVDAGGALAGGLNSVGSYGLRTVVPSEIAEKAADDLSAWWVDAGAVLAMCVERSPHVAGAVALEWTDREPVEGGR